MARPADPQRRETILRAATELFTEQGYSDTRLVDIAKRARVVVSTLYLYFPSKEEMVRAIASDIQQQVLSELRPVLEHLHSEADIARLVEVVCAFAHEHGDAIRIFNLDSGLRGVRMGIRATQGPRIQQGIEVLTGLMEAGYLRPYDPDNLVDVLIATVRWIVSKCLALEEDERELEPFKRFCAQWLCHALLPASPA